MPLKLPVVRTAPLGLMVPVTPSPMTLPLVTTTAPLVVLPQPTELTTQAPSKLPPPPPLLLGATRRGSAGSDLLRRAGPSTERGASRVPDSDFSSLPMLPPALPCAKAQLMPIATIKGVQSRADLIER